jgi:integrase
LLRVEVGVARRQWGRIRKLPSGRYQARRPDGTTAPDTFSTKADAGRWLAAAETDIARGLLAKPKPSPLTVTEWLQQWQDEHSLHKRPGTLARDASAIRRHIVPRLGDRDVRELEPVDLQRFVASVASEVGPGTTRAVYAVLRSSLNDAVRLEVLERTPARGVKLPPVVRSDVLTLELPQLHELALVTPEPWRPVIYVAGTCGLRFAEIAGLRRGRVDLDARLLRVIETAPQRGSDRAEPKSKAGRRNVPMASFVADLLRDHVRGVEDPDALVFTAHQGGRLHASNWHKQVWAPARRRAGLPSLRFHDLRHSAVPLWISMGANLLQVSRWLGHSSVQITADVYGHLFPETNAAVIDRLDHALLASARRLAK